MGGYVAMRHNILRVIEGGLLAKVCKDVKLEPELMPSNSEISDWTFQQEKYGQYRRRLSLT